MLWQEYHGRVEDSSMLGIDHNSSWSVRHFVDGEINEVILALCPSQIKSAIYLKSMSLGILVDML